MLMEIEGTREEGTPEEDLMGLCQRGYRDSPGANVVKLSPVGIFW